jgi:hypothetical protein
MNARDELRNLVEDTFDDVGIVYDAITDAVLAAGYRKIFDGDCGLKGIDDPASREAAEAWMRWANLLNTGFGEPNGIAAMKQMLSEFGYMRPRTITTTEELNALGRMATVLDSHGAVWVNDGDHAQPWASFAEDPQGGPIWSDGEELALPATVIYSPEASA